MELEGELVTPAAAIAMLDRQLARSGQTVEITKPAGGDPVQARAFVRVAKKDEIAGLVQQVWWKVILSPTGRGAALPLKKGDWIRIEDKKRAVEIYQPVRMADTLVRVELLVAG
jgi:hypothetical protein